MNDIKDLLPLLSTLVGGILVVIGGITSSFLIQRQTSSRERKKILIQKAEELYVMILKLDHFTQCISNKIRNSLEGDAPDDVSLSQYEYKQLVMLVGLYFPDLIDDANKYIEIRREHMLIYAGCLNAASEENKMPTEEEILKISEVQNDYNTISDSLKKSLIICANI